MAAHRAWEQCNIAKYPFAFQRDFLLDAIWFCPEFVSPYRSCIVLTGAIQLTFMYPLFFWVLKLKNVILTSFCVLQLSAKVTLENFGRFWCGELNIRVQYINTEKRNCFIAFSSYDQRDDEGADVRTFHKMFCYLMLHEEIQIRLYTICS